MVKLVAFTSVAFTLVAFTLVAFTIVAFTLVAFTLVATLPVITKGTIMDNHPVVNITVEEDNFIDLLCKIKSYLFIGTKVSPGFDIKAAVGTTLRSIF